MLRTSHLCAHGGWIRENAPGIRREVASFHATLIPLLTLRWKRRHWVLAMSSILRTDWMQIQRQLFEAPVSRSVTVEADAGVTASGCQLASANSGILAVARCRLFLDLQTAQSERFLLPVFCSISFNYVEPPTPRNHDDTA